MGAPWLMDVLADEFRGSKGFQVDYVPGFQTRSANNTFFRPEGVMNHHTGPGSYNALLNYMAFSSSIAPLCNFATSRPHDGIVRATIVAAGRANHAGRGELSWRLGQGSVGNAYSIGGEHQNSGTQSWPTQQLECIYRCDAAILRYLKKNTSRLTDHKTYAPSRKFDPVHLPLSSQRKVVDQLLTSPLPPVQEDDMFTEDDRRKIDEIYAALGGTADQKPRNIAKDNVYMRRDFRLVGQRLWLPVRHDHDVPTEIES